MKTHPLVVDFPLSSTSGDFEKPWPNNTSREQQEFDVIKNQRPLKTPLGLSACAVGVSSGFRSSLSVLGPNCAVTHARENFQVAVK